MADKGLRHNMSHFGQSELDLSFLKEEEANRILEVLERDERLRRTEQERLSKLKSWKRDVKWLHGVSGEWFEEIQKKKFKDDPDVRSLVRPPLNHRLKKKTPKGEPESSRMTTSRNFQSPKNSGPSFLGLRSPLSSLFSFRKSAKQTLKPPSQHERHGIFSVSGQLPPNTKVDRKFDIYHSTRSVKQIASFFEEQHNNRARENDTTKATNQLEREVLQVLGDLDQKLAQEQNHNRAPRISRLANYTYGRQYSKEGLLHNKAEPKNVYGCLPSHDGRRSGPPEGTHTTYATYQPRNFYEMYSNRQRRVSKPEGSNKSFYNKSPSLFSAVSNITPRSSPASGSFSTSSLQLSSPGLNLERIRQNKSRRTPITSIKWNNSVSSGHPEGIGRAFRTKSALDLTNLDEPNHLCKYKNVPGPPVSTSNDLHKARNIKNLTNTTCMNIVDNGSTGYYITDSPGHCPEVKFSTQPERHWEEDFKKTSFNKNEMSRAPSDNTGSSDMETEPMELESDLSVQPDASSVAIEEPSIHEGDIPVDCTLHNPEPLEVSSSHISEPENMDIDAPNVFLNSRNSSTSTVGLGPSAHEEDHVPPKTEVPGLALTDRNRSLDTIKKFSSFDHGTVYKVDTSSFTNPKSSEIGDQVNKSDHKSSSLSGNTTDVGGRFAWMNMRRGSNNHTEGFRSDALKFQKRNASSLPDLLDQDSEIVANNSDVTLHKRTCENVLECDATTVPATQPSSRISNDSNEQHLENDSKYEQPCVQNAIPQKLKNLSTRNHQYLQKPNMFSYCGAFKNLDRISTFPAVPYEAESLKEKYNHTGFLSDTLKYKKRNASSLSDLLDQESDIFGNDPKNILRKNGCGHDGDYHTSTVLETRSSRIPDERKERYLESSTRYQQSGVQDTNQQPKISTSSIWQSIQRVSPFSRGSELNGSSIQTEKTATESEVAYQADRVTENNKFKNLLHLTETTPFSNVHAKYKSVNFNRGQYNGSDSNNNTQLIGGIQTSDILNKDKSRIEKGYIHQNQDHPEKEQVKSLKCDTSSKPNLSSIYQKDAASSANQKNTDQDRQVEQGCESEGNLNQNLIYQLDQEANNKVEYTDPPKIRGSSRFPVSHFVKECSEEDNFSRATHLHNIESKSTNLLKQHLFVAPEPFKGNVRVSVIPKSEWKNLTSSEDSQSPTHQEGENIKNLDSDYRASEEDLQPHKTYSCQQIVENTEMYESLTDTYAEVDKIEYRKVVSVYYSFPRKFASRISDLSKNNLKNIDQTLQQSRAPSALLDIIGRCHKEEPDFHLQSSEDVKTSITEAVHSVADVPSQTHHLNFHIIPLQTNLLKNGSRTNSGEENDDLVNKFSSLHISKNEDNHKAREDPKNKNKYSPSGSSPRYSPNACYFTLPNRKSSLQDLERNVLERDIAMARDRFNIYPGSRNMEPSPPEFQDVFASPTACYDNLNYSPGYDFMHFQESSKQEYNINNIFARDGGFYKKNSMDEGIILREDLPSIYKSKSYKDLSQHKSYNTEDISPHTDCNTSPQIDYNHPVFSKNSSVINQARPSYCSEFVQKKMKPINTKKFSLSVDRSSQESVSPRHTGSYDDTIRLFDGNSPSVFHSPNNNYTSHADKYFGQTKPRDSGNSNLYRSKSMKVLNTEGQQNFVDYKQKSDGSFSSKSYGGTLRSKSPSGKTWNRTSSAEILDENDNWPVSDERKAVCTSKSFDYGIFGKEQQEAIVNNVKRSLTEGRLWRPSFLKNPGFLRTEELCSSQEINPVGQTPDESSSQRPNVKESLNIYEDVHVVPSDSDTETTTEDEYYLDEYYLNDKESEL